MTVVPRTATDEQGSFLRALHEALESHPGLDKETALAVASNFVGRLVVLQGLQMTASAANDVIVRNIVQGNQEAVRCVRLIYETAGHA